MGHDKLHILLKYWAPRPNQKEKLGGFGGQQAPNKTYYLLVKPLGEGLFWAQEANI